MQWIDINKEWPKHEQTVLALSPKGYCVVFFVNSKNMNDDLMKTPWANECVDLEKHPYYFVSQEIKQNTMGNVTHWMPLPERPV